MSDFNLHCVIKDKKERRVVLDFENSKEKNRLLNHIHSTSSTIILKKKRNIEKIILLTINKDGEDMKKEGFTFPLLLGSSFTDS